MFRSDFTSNRTESEMKQSTKIDRSARRAERLRRSLVLGLDEAAPGLNCRNPLILMVFGCLCVQLCAAVPLEIQENCGIQLRNTYILYDCNHHWR